ncbi:hypothetical protein I4J07_11240, partial [Corynebacterium diphtheriae bv. gravis]|nr:hypothetical protein [Corynebacterium diphtheriae bv. gravis]
MFNARPAERVAVVCFIILNIPIRRGRLRVVNPDWAIVKQVDGEDKLYMIRETKSTMIEHLLRTTEQAKIDAA